MQKRRNSSANALELRLSCTNPSKWTAQFSSWERLCIQCGNCRWRRWIMLQTLNNIKKTKKTYVTYSSTLGVFYEWFGKNIPCTITGLRLRKPLIFPTMSSKFQIYKDKEIWTNKHGLKYEMYKGDINLCQLLWRFKQTFWISCSIALVTRMWNMISSLTTPTMCLEQKSDNFQSRNVTLSMPSQSQK